MVPTRASRARRRPLSPTAETSVAVEADATHRQDRRRMTRTQPQSRKYLVEHNAPPDISGRIGVRDGKRDVRNASGQVNETVGQGTQEPDQKEPQDRQKQEKKEHTDATERSKFQRGKRSQNQQESKKNPKAHIINEKQNPNSQKETTRVLHPASRPTPGNGVVPPFPRGF